MTEEPAGKTSRLPFYVAGGVAAVALAAGAVTLALSGGRSETPSAGDQVIAASTPTEATTSADPQSPAQQPGATTSPPAGDPQVSTASATGSAITFADDSLTFSASLPSGPEDDPVLAPLRQDATAYLATMKANARADYDRLKKSGVAPTPWEVRIAWRYTAKVDGIASLAGESAEYTGGAHSMLRFDTRIARTSGQVLEVRDLLMPNRTPSPALTIGICEALKAAKMERIKAATVFDEPINCVGLNSNVNVEQAKFALAPSSQDNKFGGLYVYYEPYAVGSFAEGPYRLTVPQGVFADDLRPEFRSLFAGEAPRLRD